MIQICKNCYYSRDWCCPVDRKKKRLECLKDINEPGGKPFTVNEKSNCPKFKEKV
jgi:hypothetical protein